MENKKKPKIKCNYCEKNSFFLYKRDKTNKIVWAICFECVKKFFDKILGKGKNGGRISA